MVWRSHFSYLNFIEFQSLTLCRLSTLSSFARKKYEKDHEIAALKMAQPDEGDPHAPAMKASKEKMLMTEKNDQNRSLKTGRLFPIPNKPDPMPQLGGFG